MKTPFVLLLCLVLLSKLTHAQNYSPVSTFGYNLDAVAENTTALANTGGAIDGSDYVLYSEAYGTLFNIVGGLPNSGVVSSPGYSFQLQSYSQNNLLYVLIGQTHTISITNPSAYASISLLGFATEGTGNMNVTLGFTDNSTQTFNNLVVNDWFAAAGAVVSGFGRCGRTSGTIVNPAGQPKLFNINLHLTCVNRSKNLAYIAVQNASGNARLCMMAVSGSGAPSYTANSTPVSCPGGTNGTASVSITNSLPPNTFTWSSSPLQNTALASNLTAGNYSYTVSDGAGCIFGSTVAIGVSTVPLSPLLIGTSSTLVCPGSPVTLSTFGAVSYTWSNGVNSPVTTVSPQVASNYSVAGVTAANCLVSGSVNITTHTVQPISINPIGAQYCANASSIALVANPPGGNFSGAGVSGTVFFPSTAGTGTVTITYVYTDANACISNQSLSTVVHPLPQVNFTLANQVYCLNAGTVALNATPAGGSYSGMGISGSSFNPALHFVGNSVLSYTYTDANACSNYANLSVTVNPLPMVSFVTLPAALCIKASSINLLASPIGGTFSGPGVSGSAFSPSVAGLGTHLIVYSFTEASTSCSNSAIHTITVSSCVGFYDTQTPGAQDLLIYPNPSNSLFHIQGNEDGSILILNPLGQVVAKCTLNPKNGHTIVIENLPHALYSLLFTTQSGTKVYKVLVSQ